MSYDPRLTPARPDLAAAHLEGRVEAARFVEGRALRVAVAVLPMTATADPEAGFSSQLLMGEPFVVYETDAPTGLAWGQAGRDGYVGYVPAAGLDGDAAAPTHHVPTLMTHCYPEPDLKTRPFDALPYLAEVRVSGQEGSFLELATGGFVPGRHLREGAPEATDWVAEAERFLGLPYVWGGKSTLGLDCSALVQLARHGTGLDCPRDSDMQAGLGAAVDGPFQRGDLVCWKGHIGVMLDGSTLLHANGFHMAVVREPLELARDRILAAEGLTVTTVRRLD
ncbi:MAG: NlpC/P60 family protein [Pseudomonadota bacterium]